MKRGKFKVAGNPRAIDPIFERVGLYDDLFGIHASGREKTITHLASGLKCGEAKTEREARSKCSEFRALPIDWSLVDPIKGLSEETIRSLRSIAIGGFD